MAFLKSLFNKKKEDDDGQEEYFKEDFAPIVKQASKSKATVKPSEPEKNAKAEKAAVNKKSSPKPVKSEKAIEEKKTAKPKKAVTTEKSASQPAKKASTAKTADKNTSAKKKSPKGKELSDDSPEVKGAVAISESKSTANGKWDIRKAKDGRYFFSLYASNHTVIAYSQIYSSITAVNTGIASVIANAAKAETEDTTLKKSVSLPCPKWEIYLDKAGEYRFRLYAPNGLIVCHASHGYATKSGCKGGIESIKRFASDEAIVSKTYLK
ncbi:MAG: DUF1508 domain-containing protein [Clostridia bacterium]|nr:DUF1508 domain-containing protein [Clostridia bacterium]